MWVDYQRRKKWPMSKDGIFSLTSPDPIGDAITCPIRSTGRPRYCCMVAPLTRGYCTWERNEMLNLWTSESKIQLVESNLRPFLGEILRTGLRNCQLKCRSLRWLWAREKRGKYCLYLCQRYQFGRFKIQIFSKIIFFLGVRGFRFRDSFLVSVFALHSSQLAQSSSKQASGFQSKSHNICLNSKDHYCCKRVE